MEFVLLVVLLVVVVAVVGGAALAQSGRRKYALSNQVVPGLATSAPASWAGSHTPEARLHRRLRDAVAALRAHPRADDPGLADLRASFEQQALAVDERLIAIAALPDRVKTDRVGEVESAVAAVEEVAASLAAGAAPDAASLESSTAEIEERLRLLAEARAELDGLPTQPAPPPGAVSDG